MEKPVEPNAAPGREAQARSKVSSKHCIEPAAEPQDSTPNVQSFVACAIDESPVLLTYPQVADALGVSSRTVWTLVSERKLAAVRFAGRTVRIDRRDLEAFIARCKAASNGN